MTRRAGRWDLLDQPGDPVPADGHNVATVAQTYQKRGQDLADTSSTLNRLSQLDGWQGKAATAFAERSTTLSENLQGASERYDGAANALNAFVGHVNDARATSKSALFEAEDAERRRVANSHPIHLGSDPSPALVAAEHRRVAQLNQAMHDLNAAKKRLNRALDSLESAARKCAGDIKAAAEHYKDGFVDNFKGWVRKHADFLKALVDILGKIALAIAAIALVIAVVVAVVGTGGAVLAALAALAPLVAVVATTVGAIVALISLSAHTAMMYAGVDEVGWDDIAFDVIGLVTFGLGTKFAGAARALKSAKGAVRYSASPAARNAEKAALREALKGSTPSSTAERLKAAALGGVDDVKVLNQLRVLKELGGPSAHRYAEDGLRNITNHLITDAIGNWSGVVDSATQNAGWRVGTASP